KRVPVTGNTSPCGLSCYIERVRRFTRRWIAPSGGRGSEGGDLWAARPTWIRKLKGKVAWRGSVGHREDAEGAAAQCPRDRPKAKLLEAQSPAVQAFTLCDTASEVAATGIRRLRISSSQPFRPVGGRQRACSRGRTGPPTSR